VKRYDEIAGAEKYFTRTDSYYAYYEPGSRNLGEQVKRQTQRVGTFDLAVRRLDQIGIKGGNDEVRLDGVKLGRAWAQQNLKELERVMVEFGPDGPPIMMGQ